MIIAEPFGGLSNRIRMLNAALNLAADTSHELQILWNQNQYLNAAWETLFEPWPETITNRQIQSVTTAPPQRRLGDIKAKLYQWYKRHDFMRLTNTELAASPDCFQRQNFLRANSIHIYSDQPFYGTTNRLNRFQPIAELQSTINAITSKYNPHTYGVHIRRTDNAEAIRRSPTAAFIELIERIVDQHASAQFFIATDDANVLQNLTHRLGHRVLSQNQIERSRNAATGIQSAVVDLYCLAHTSTIIGSAWSSFSEIAAQIGLTPLHTVDLDPAAGGSALPSMPAPQGLQLIDLPTMLPTKP